MATPTPTSDADAGYPGSDNAFSGGSDFNAHSFLVAQIIARIAGATLVQVKAVTNTGGLAPVGFVDVQPMVNMIDDSGNATPHGVIHHVPYFRLQGGTDAVIIDPKLNDIGVAIFADRDISSVKATKAPANPATRRQNDMADGLYIGGVLNGTPTQYIAFESGGIGVVSPTAVLVTAPVIGMTATTGIAITTPTLALTGDFTATGNITGGSGGADQVGLRTHRHGVGTAAAGTVAPSAGT